MLWHSHWMFCWIFSRLRVWVWRTCDWRRIRVTWSTLWEPITHWKNSTSGAVRCKSTVSDQLFFMLYSCHLYLLFVLNDRPAIYHWLWASAPIGVCVYIYNYVCIFIHSLYCTHTRLLLRHAPDPSTVKKDSLRSRPTHTYSRLNNYIWM